MHYDHTAMPESTMTLNNSVLYTVGMTHYTILVRYSLNSVSFSHYLLAHVVYTYSTLWEQHCFNHKCECKAILNSAMRSLPW